MIYLMNQKFLAKNIKKIAAMGEYFIIDAENYGSASAIVSVDKTISSSYSKAKGIGGLSPELNLYDQLRRINDGKEVNKTRYERNLENFLDDPNFLGSVGVLFKSFVLGKNNNTNILVVLPNVVWSVIGKIYFDTLVDIAKVDFEFIRVQADIKQDKKCLKDHISNAQYDKINKIANKLCEKYDSAEVSLSSMITTAGRPTTDNFNSNRKYGYERW